LQGREGQHTDSKNRNGNKNFQHAEPFIPICIQK
jgi:hypothetical protein